MTSGPLVSVIIPTFNRAATVGLSIDSALAQSYRPLEVIVVDDGSTDSTLEVLQGYGDSIIVVARENGGPSAARNSGVSVSKGEIISFLDSDDLWKADKIRRQVLLMEAGGPDVPCCICNAALIDERVGSRTTSFEVSGVMSNLVEGYWANPAPLMATRFVLFNQVVAIRREAFSRVGGFNPDMRLLEDYDLAFRLSVLGPWAFISEPLVDKFNDDDGIGVAAMRDPFLHSRVWKEVLERFLRITSSETPEVVRLLKRAHSDVIEEIRSLECQHSDSWMARRIGDMRMRFLRKRQAIRRRFPRWPRVKTYVLEG